MGTSQNFYFPCVGYQAGNRGKTANERPPAEVSRGGLVRVPCQVRSNTLPLAHHRSPSGSTGASLVLGYDSLASLGQARARHPEVTSQSLLHGVVNWLWRVLEIRLHLVLPAIYSPEMSGVTLRCSLQASDLKKHQKEGTPEQTPVSANGGSSCSTQTKPLGCLLTLFQGDVVMRDKTTAPRPSLLPA